MQMNGQAAVKRKRTVGRNCRQSIKIPCTNFHVYIIAPNIILVGKAQVMIVQLMVLGSASGYTNSGASKFLKQSWEMKDSYNAVGAQLLWSSTLPMLPRDQGNCWENLEDSVDRSLYPECWSCKELPKVHVSWLLLGLKQAFLRWQNLCTSRMLSVCSVQLFGFWDFSAFLHKSFQKGNLMYV